MNSLSNYLWKRLVIPFSILVLASLIIAKFVQWQGIFVNLAATFIGILLTVLYVDYILKQHEKGRWAAAEFLINRRIERFAIVTSTQFRLVFGFKSDIYDRNINMENPSSRRLEIIRINENLLLPSVSNKIQNLNQEDWKKLARQMQITWEMGDKLYEVFGNRLDPLIVSSILSIQDEIESVFNYYRIWPDILGVPDEELPVSRKTDITKDKRAMEDNITKHVNNILLKSTELLRNLEPKI